MADKQANTERAVSNERIILAAIESLNLESMSSQEELYRKVAHRSLTIAKMLSPNSYNMDVLDSVRIFSTVNAIDFEESSNRYVIRFKAMQDGSAEEIIRTPRMDNIRGKAILPIVQKITNKLAEGGAVRAVIYKHNEMPKDAAQTKSVPQGYRTCVWMEIVG